MTSRLQVYRASTTNQDLVAELRRLVQDARALLKQPPPDTFLGRKTFEPFPPEDKRGAIATPRRLSRLMPDAREGRTKDEVMPDVR
jgi:hypothetical protein